VFIYALIFFIIIFVFLLHHGAEIVFDANDTRYEFGIYYLIFGKFRLFEIKKVRQKDIDRYKKLKLGLGFIKYLRGKINVSYTISTANLTPAYAITSGAICSLLEVLDSWTKLDVVQNIHYTNWGMHLDIKFNTSILNVLVSFIEYKIKKGNKLLIKKG